LQKFDFSRNQLFDENASELASALLKFRKLKFLDLTSVGLADQELSLFCTNFLPNS